MSWRVSPRTERASRIDTHQFHVMFAEVVAPVLPAERELGHGGGARAFQGRSGGGVVRALDCASRVPRLWISGERA